MCHEENSQGLSVLNQNIPRSHLKMAAAEQVFQNTDVTALEAFMFPLNSTKSFFSEVKEHIDKLRFIFRLYSQVSFVIKKKCMNGFTNDLSLGRSTQSTVVYTVYIF